MKKIYLILFIAISAKGLCQNPSLSSYLDTNNNFKLSYVANVSSDKNTLSLFGTRGGATVTQKVDLEYGEALGIWNNEYFKISLLTIPFKVRGSREGFPSVAAADLKNIGLNLNLYSRNLDRYFWDGKKSTHKFGVGVFMAPTVEELTPETTKDLITEKTKQLFVSAGLSLSYTYNNIQLTFTPAAFDFGTTSLGKNWIYNQVRWFGFGIGIDPKIFAPSINK